MRTATLIALALLVGGCDLRLGSDKPGIQQCNCAGEKLVSECAHVNATNRCDTEDGAVILADDKCVCIIRRYGKAERLAFEARLAAAKVPRPPAPKKAPVPKVEPEPEAMQSVPE